MKKTFDLSYPPTEQHLRGRMKAELYEPMLAYGFIVELLENLIICNLMSQTAAYAYQATIGSY